MYYTCIIIVIVDCDVIVSLLPCRLEIFEIHTRAMRRSGLLGEDVSLIELAANTSGYSGAEIAGCVRGASSYALERQPRQVGLCGCGQ